MNPTKEWRSETNKKTLTTGQVAKICDVAPRTVSKWIDSGRLPGYRVAGSPDRRVPREVLVQFLRDNHMPMGFLEDIKTHRILVIGADARLQETLRQHILDRCEAEIAFAASSFEAGVCAERLRPNCVVIDMALGRIEAGQIVQAMKLEQRGTVFLALTSDEPMYVFSLGFDDAFKKPFDGALFAERVRRLLAQETNGQRGRGMA